MSIETGNQQDIQYQSLDMVYKYFEVLCGSDLESYRAAEGMLDDVFFNNTPGSSSHEGHTWHASHYLEKYYNDPADLKSLQSFNTWRKAATAHAVRGAIQGGKFPVAQFDQVIQASLHTLAVIDGVVSPTKDHHRRIREEILDVCDCAHIQPRDGAELRRAAEAYLLIGGSPRAYGRMMVRGARADKKEAKQIAKYQKQ